MHMAIALKKWVIAWFGPTCSHEIDLYGRGVAIETKAPCSPCWKRECHKPLMCYDQVNFDEISKGVSLGLKPEKVFAPKAKKLPEISL
jgi:heptosyltransferase-2